MSSSSRCQGITVANNSWSPDGTRLALYVIEGYGVKEVLGRTPFRGRIVLIEFEAPQ